MELHGRDPRVQQYMDIIMDIRDGGGKRRNGFVSGLRNKWLCRLLRYEY